MSKIQELNIGQRVRVVNPEFAKEWDGVYFIRELSVASNGRENIGISESMERMGCYDGWDAKSLESVDTRLPDCDKLLALARQVAALNPDAGTIGEGMLCRLHAMAMEALGNSEPSTQAVIEKLTV